MKEKSICKVRKNIGVTCECFQGYKIWYLGVNFHREDGPAIEWGNGDNEWYLNGLKYDKKDYYKELVKRNIMTYEEAVLEML